MPDLETVNLSSVEILSTGTWNGDVYDLKDLTDMVTAFTEADIQPPVKLGHAKNQRLLQEDGYPAAGYVQRVYLKGEKLLADLRDVPRKIADLVKAKAYSKVSSEVYFNYRAADGKRFPRVLKGIAFLGADIPAVTTLKDIEALYGADMATVKRLYGYDETATEDEDVEVHLAEQPDIEEMDEEDLLQALDRYAEKLEAQCRGKTGMPAARTLLRETRNRIASIRGATTQSKENTMNPEILKKLGLKPEATEEEISAAIDELSNKPAEGTYVSKAEYDSLQSRVGELTANLAAQQAEAAVEDAIRAGKVLPAQKEWAINYAKTSPDGFKAYTEASPTLIETGQRGQDGSSGALNVEITNAERLVAKSLGFDETKLLEFKQKASV